MTMSQSAMVDNFRRRLVSDFRLSDMVVVMSAIPLSSCATVNCQVAVARWCKARDKRQPCKVALLAAFSLCVCAQRHNCACVCGVCCVACVLCMWCVWCGVWCVCVRVSGTVPTGSQQWVDYSHLIFAGYPLVSQAGTVLVFPTGPQPLSSWFPTVLSHWFPDWFPATFLLVPHRRFLAGPQSLSCQGSRRVNKSWLLNALHFPAGVLWLACSSSWGVVNRLIQTQRRLVPPAAPAPPLYCSPSRHLAAPGGTAPSTRHLVAPAGTNEQLCMCVWGFHIPV